MRESLFAECATEGETGKARIFSFYIYFARKVNADAIKISQIAN